jgi:hypothetical protein
VDIERQGLTEFKSSLGGLKVNLAFGSIPYILLTDDTLFWQLTNIPRILGWKTDDRRFPKIWR